jgi:signal transduction histidine kinase
VVTHFDWQTWWFRAAVLVLFTSTVIATVRYVSFRRLRTKLRTLEQHAALDREKARIARDLHDNLGSRLTKIISLSKATLHDSEAPDKTAAHARQIGTTASQVINLLDETVWVLNSRNDTLPNLIDYLGQSSAEFLRAAGVRCRVDFPDHPRELPVSADARHNLFLVVQEALNNVVRHAGAAEVRLRAVESGQSLSFTLEDNGRGFVPASVNGGGDGLRNMRQRMEEMGGKFSMDSEPGAGARITLVLPLNSAAN